MNKEITVYNLSGLPTADIDAFHELQEDFKLDDPNGSAKLQMLILTRGFKYAFNAWRDEHGRLWIIDAHQRKKALIALRKAGFIVPPIPYQEIFAESKADAVSEIAAFNSSFAEINKDTDLFKKYNITTDTLERFNLGFEAKTFVPQEKRAIDFDQMIESNSTIGLDEYDDIEEDELILNEQPTSKLGDIWLIGSHRLMCGDSTRSSDVRRLMAGKSADICITDPPYNVAYTGGTDDELTIQNDDMGNDDFYTFLLSVYRRIFESLKPGGPCYIFHADSEGVNFRRAMRDAGLKLAQCCVWVKNSFVMGRQDYQWKHEPILYGWKPGAAHVWSSDRRQSTVWTYDKPQRNGIHPTMKPIPLICYPLSNSSKIGDIVLDLFGGSGSTMIASHKLERTCYSMELDPKYVDASVRRFRSLFPDIPITLLRDNKEIEYNESGLEE